MAFASSSSTSVTYLLTALGHHDSNSSAASGSTNPDSEDSQLSLVGHNQNQGHRPNGPPRQKINARERYRTFNVNSAYEALRSLIPTEPVNRKLSKIEIIRLASSYITHLNSTLHAGTDHQPCLIHQQNNEGSEFATRIRICTFCLKSK
ncbi:basic helix-loop-helix transcription factor scleraxis [Drosophila tropicalis]|uniref:basic helix-loop-helix transcription factor scleraxis n=1 Tax=Drosophila tropicalis TaxID=46794 RepID=UPI0035AB9187